MFWAWVCRVCMGIRPLSRVAWGVIPYDPVRPTAPTPPRFTGQVCKEVDVVRAGNLSHLFRHVGMDGGRYDFVVLTRLYRLVTQDLFELLAVFPPSEMEAPPGVYPLSMREGEAGGGVKTEGVLYAARCAALGLRRGGVAGGGVKTECIVRSEMFCTAARGGMSVLRTLLVFSCIGRGQSWSEGLGWGGGIEGVGGGHV